MKFIPEFRPWLVVSNDEARQHLIHIRLDVEGKRMVATNGHMLVFIPVDVSKDDKSGALTTDCVRWAAEHLTRDRAEIDCSSEAVAVVGDVTFKRPQGIKFPPADSIEPPKGKTHVFALDARYLIQLANAIGQGEPRSNRPAIVRLTVEAESGTINCMKVDCEGYGEESPYGLLMPVRV